MGLYLIFVGMSNTITGPNLMLLSKNAQFPQFLHHIAGQKATYLVNLFLFLRPVSSENTDSVREQLPNKTEKGTSFEPSYYGENHVPISV